MAERLPDSVSSSSRGAGNDAREHIYQATLNCFERLGIRGTRMSDVAETAGISTPAIYYHFGDKEGLIAEVVIRQTRRVYDDVRAQLERYRGERPLIVMAMLQGLELARADPYLSLLIKPDNAKLTAKLSERGTVAQVRRSFWMPIFSRARERGQLRRDIDSDDLIRWLTGIEFMLVTEGEHLGMNTQREVEHQLMTFLVPALAS